MAVVLTAIGIASLSANAQKSAFADAVKQIPVDVHSLGTIVRIIPPEDALTAMIDISNDSVPNVNWRRSNITASKNQIFSGLSVGDLVLIGLAEASYNVGCPFTIRYRSTIGSDVFDLDCLYSELQNKLTRLSRENVGNPQSKLTEILNGEEIGFSVPLYIPNQGSLVSIVSPVKPLTIVVDITNIADSKKLSWMKDNISAVKARYLSEYSTLGNTMISLLRAAYYVGCPLSIEFISASSPEGFEISYSVRDLASIITLINN